MRYIAIAGLILSILFISDYAHASLFSGVKNTITTQPFGGRISYTPETLNTSVTCTGIYGPFGIVPSNKAPTVPYFIEKGTVTPRANGWILGLYTPNLGGCVNTETGVPVPAFKVTIYGASR